MSKFNPIAWLVVGVIFIVFALQDATQWLLDKCGYYDWYHKRRR